LNSPNFLGNSNSYISAPFADLNLGVTNGSLVVSNLLTPFVPSLTGEIRAYSGSYFFTETNTPPGSTNVITITNYVRILIVLSGLEATTTAQQKDVTFHAANDLQISDQFTIFDNFASDTAKLTISTNGDGAYGLFGRLMITEQSYNWSANLPNLQYL